MKPHKVSDEHAAELKQMAARLQEITVESGMSVVTLTGYDWSHEPRRVYIHAHNNVEAPGCGEPRLSGSHMFRDWFRDGIEYHSMVTEER
jgi:hypothetical protein